MTETEWELREFMSDESKEVVAEIVQWNDVVMLRTILSAKKRKWDFNRFEIPAELYERWDNSIDEYWAVQYEIRKYMSGEKRV